MFKQMISFVVVALLVLALAPTASAETVNFGTLQDIPTSDSLSVLDLGGVITYAVNLGGTSGDVSVGGVAFKQDDDAAGSNNDTGVGTTMSTDVSGYYQGLNAVTSNNTNFSSDTNLNTIMTNIREDSGARRVSQFDVTTGNAYRVQVLAKAKNTEDRRFDLAVGFGTAADKVSNGTLDAWHEANLAVDNLEESTPQVWSHAFVATSDKLWIGASQANTYGTTHGGADGNPVVQAFIVTELVTIDINSDLVPDGLVAGDTFQLAFSSSVRMNEGGLSLSGKDSSLADFDAAVQNLADNSSIAEVANLGATWSVIASSNTEDARDHAALGASTPLYTVNGDIIATGFADLWDGGLTNSLRNENGDGPGSEAGTGTLTTGYKSSNPIGTGSNFSRGLAGATNSDWIDTSSTSGDPSYFYGMSNEILIVPEPSTLILLATGLLGLLAYAWRRRKR